VDGGYARARDLLATHEDQLHTLAKALLEYETLSGEEITKVLEGGTIDRGTSNRPVVPAAGVGIPKTRKAGGFGGAAPAGA
jgi:cell division protease FtsH